MILTGVTAHGFISMLPAVESPNVRNETSNTPQMRTVCVASNGQTHLEACCHLLLASCSGGESETSTPRCLAGQQFHPATSARTVLKMLAIAHPSSTTTARYIGATEHVEGSVGDSVGLCVGEIVGTLVGASVGETEGAKLGVVVGNASVGIRVGAPVGAGVVGALVGAGVVGASVGPNVVGAPVVGTPVGAPVDGVLLGPGVVGVPVVGEPVGVSVGTGVVGASVGATVVGVPVGVPVVGVCVVGASVSSLLPIKGFSTAWTSISIAVGRSRSYDRLTVLLYT